MQDLKVLLSRFFSTKLSETAVGDGLFKLSVLKVFMSLKLFKSYKYIVIGGVK